MASMLKRGLRPNCWSLERLRTAKYAFERTGTPSSVRPQLPCRREQLTPAAAVSHDEGLADLERRSGRESGSFGGRMPTATLVSYSLEQDLFATVSLLGEITRVMAVAGASAVLMLTAGACLFML